MIGSTPQKIKDKNKEYTKECKKIFKEIEFAEIITQGLPCNLILVPFLSIFVFIMTGFMIYLIIDWILHPELENIVVSSVIMLILSAVMIVGSIIIIVRTKRKDREKRGDFSLSYFIQYDDKLYEVTLRDNFNERAINSIVCYNTNQILYVGGDGAELDTYSGVTEEEGLDFTGFYQFLCIPQKVVRHSHIWTDAIYKYKREQGNSVMYYFPKFRNTKEEKYPRSLLLENGVVKKVCVQETYNSYYQEDRRTDANVTTKRMTYSHVNDPDCKLYMSPKEYEQALKLDFPFPKVVQIAAKEYSELN